MDLRALLDLRQKPSEDWTFKENKRFDYTLIDFRRVYWKHDRKVYLNGGLLAPTLRQRHFISVILPALLELPIFPPEDEADMVSTEEEVQFYLKFHELNDTLRVE